MRVIAILKNNNGETIGARIENDSKIIDATTEQLKEKYKSIKFDNAILNNNGYVKSKSGKLPKIIKKITPNTIENSEMVAAKKLLNQLSIVLYHGSKNNSMIPLHNKGKSTNDYGRGFYTTPNKELAKEWAWGTYSKGDKAYVYSYKLNIENLTILNLTEIDSLHWIAELIYNRKINLDGKEVVKDNTSAFLHKYKLDTSKYDIIIGYRADDSYYAYAESFISGAIYKETLEKALRTGELGLQVFIKSKKAFEKLRYTSMEEVPNIYRQRFINRDQRARNTYNMLRQNQGNIKNKQTIFDFL